MKRLMMARKCQKTSQKHLFSRVFTRFFPYIVAILFTNYVYKLLAGIFRGTKPVRSGLKTMKDWASKMQTHFEAGLRSKTYENRIFAAESGRFGGLEDTCQMQMRAWDWVSALTLSKVCVEVENPSGK